MGAVLVSKRHDPIRYIKIKVDERSHISQRDAQKCDACQHRPCLMFCPSQVFEWEAAQGLSIRYERCVECGACLRACPYTNIAWDYPRAGYGICHEF